MEPQKTKEAYAMAHRLCNLLQRHSRNTGVIDEERGAALGVEQRQEFTKKESPLVLLQQQLREFLPVLSILHSFARGKRASHAHIYEIVSHTVAQVLAMDPNPPSDAAKPAPPDTTSAAPPALAKTLGEETQGEAGETATAASHTLHLRPLQTPLRWDHVHGCEEAILALKQMTVLPRRFPWLFDGTGRSTRRPWQKLLLYGPPGTGKTLLAQATAGELPGCPYVSLSSADVLSRWVGESEKHLRAVFAQAAQHDKCMLFLDEVDALCAARGAEGETEAARRLKTELLFHLQAPPRGLLVVAATNLPWEIDSAVLRRFDAVVYVGLPDADTRRSLVAAQLHGLEHTLTAREVDWLIEQTNGFSASDVVRVLSQSAMRPLRHLVDATHLRLATDQEVFDYMSEPTSVPPQHKRERSPDSIRCCRKRQKQLASAAGSAVSTSLTSSTTLDGSLHSARVEKDNCQNSDAGRRAPLFSSPSSPTHSEAAAPRRLTPHSCRPVKLSKLRRKRPLHSPQHHDATGKVADHRDTCATQRLATSPERSAIGKSTAMDCFYVPCSSDDPRALLETFSAVHVDPSHVLLPRVSAEDVREVLRTFVPSVTAADVAKYEAWRRGQQPKGS